MTSTDSFDATSLARALAALRKGLISREALGQALRTDGDRTLIAALQASGALSPGGLAALLGTSLVLGLGADVRTLIDRELLDGVAADGYQPGDVIGGAYRVLDVKQGGLGRVYICAQLHVTYRRGNGFCALKTPIPSLLRDREAIERFVDEAVNWISLPPHPNIVLAYGVEDHARLPHITMEYVGDAGGSRTLWDSILRGEAGWELALRSGLGIARALEHAQAHGRLSHGDLKPPNVLLTVEGAVKLTDFGFSKSLATGRGVPDGWRVGTPGFMAPEMLQGDELRPTEASDIYAFGVTLFLAASARWPVAPDESQQVWFDPEDIRALVPRMPSSLGDLINACLKRDGRKRPRSFQEIRERLEEIALAAHGSVPLLDEWPDMPGPAEAFGNAAQTWLEFGEWRKARGFAEQSVALDPANWRAHNALGMIHRAAADHDKARRCFVTAHECAPDEIIPIVNGALSAYDLGDREEAGEGLATALTRVAITGDWERLDGASSLIVDLMAAEAALSLLDRIVSADARASVTWNNRAILLRRAGRPLEALDSAERAIGINLAYAKAWSNKATAQADLRRWEGALASAEEAIRLDPMLTGPYLAIATALAQTGRLDDARRVVADALALKPGDPQLERARTVFSR